MVHSPWGPISVFAVLALSPGENVGANLVRAWLGPAAGGKAGRLLTELANASLLTPAGDGPDRYRYHDRVRDYARGKLSLPEGNVRRHRMALPAYDQCIKASHVFNLLDARGVISVTERQSYILRVRELAKACGEAWLATEAGGLSSLPETPRSSFRPSAERESRDP